METAVRTQTAFRLKDNLLERLKWNAKRAHKSVNAYVEEILEEIVGGPELVFPAIPSSFFEDNRALAEQFVLKGVRLPKEYEGLDGYEQAAQDEELLMQAKYEDNA